MKKRILFEEETFEEWGNSLLCPVCEGINVHFEQTTYHNGNDNYEAWEGKGDAITVPMWCESNHYWKLRFGFHKGQTYMKIIPHL